MLLHVRNVHEKGITESQDKRNFDNVHAIVICMNSCYNFAFVLHKNALVLSQSDTRDLFTSIIGLAFPRVSLFPGIKLRCTVKYIQDEHGEKRRKNEHF